MINNSNWYRWDRLAAKSLDQQFVNEIIHGLNCSPFEAEVGIKSLLRCVAGELYRRLNIQYRQYWKVGPPSAAARNPER